MASSASSSRAAPHHEKVFIDDLALSDLTDAQQRQLASLAPRKASQRIQRTNSRHAHELVLERVDDPADASLVVCATFHPGAEGFQNYIQWRQRCPTAKFCRVQYLARLIDHKKWIPPPHWAAIGGGGAGDVLPKYHSLIDLILPTSDDDSVRPFILASASDERTQAKHLVMLLGGRPLMDTDMDADVGSATHLVCNSVMMPPAAGAEVYAGARERGLPIVSSGWLEDMVKKECYLPDISPYRLPPFKGLSIAILPSAIRNQQTRRECERAITDNGGRVLDKLSPNDLASRVSCVVVDCTDNPILEALRHPRHSHLRTVGVRWVKASVEAGYPMSYDGEGMGVAEPAWKRYQEDAEVMIPTDDQECGTWLISTVVCLTHLPPAVQHYHKILVHKGGGMLAFGYDDPAITHVLVDPSQPSNSLPSTLTAGSTGLLPPYFVTPSWLDTSNDQKQAADVGLFAAKVDRGRSVPQPPATPSQPPAPFFMLTNGNAGAPPPAPAFPQNHPAPPPSLSRQPTDMNDGGQPDAPLAPPAPFPFPPPVPPLTNPSNNHNANRNRKRKNDTRQKPPTRGWGQQNDSRYKKLDVFSQRNTGNQPQPPPPPPGPPPQRSAAPHPSRRPPALPPLNLRVKQETGQPAAAAAAVPPPAFEPIVHVKREDESEMGQEDAYSMHAEAAAGMQEGYEGYADQGGMGEGAVEGEGEMAAADGDGGGVGEDGMPSGERVCTKKIGGLLQGKWLAFLGFSDDKTENLANCITTAERLGASMVWGEAVARRDPSDIAYYVLRHDQGYRAMDRYGIPEMPEKQVTLLFLYTCWTHRRLLDLNISPIFSPNRYFTPGGDNGPLRGLRVSISGFGWRPEGASMDQVPLKKGDRELVRMMVKGMGAKEVELSSGGDKPYALVVGDERPNPAKMLSAKRRDILVLKYEWLEECWTYGRLVDHTRHEQQITANGEVFDPIKARAQVDEAYQLRRSTLLSGWQAIVSPTLAVDVKDHQSLVPDIRGCGATVTVMSPFELLQCPHIYDTLCKTYAHQQQQQPAGHKGILVVPDDEWAVLWRDHHDTQRSHQHSNGQSAGAAAAAAAAPLLPYKPTAGGGRQQQEVPAVSELHLVTTLWFNESKRHAALEPFPPPMADTGPIEELPDSSIGGGQQQVRHGDVVIPEVEQEKEEKRRKILATKRENAMHRRNVMAYAEENAAAWMEQQQARASADGAAERRR